MPPGPLVDGARLPGDTVEALEVEITCAALNIDAAAFGVAKPAPVNLSHAAEFTGYSSPGFSRIRVNKSVQRRVA
jgi:hypothetical protein